MKHPVLIEASEAWRPYRIAFDPEAPFPNERVTEILLTAYNATDRPLYLDDLEIRVAEEAPDAAGGWTAWSGLQDPGFEQGAAGWSVDAGGSAADSVAPRPHGPGHALALAAAADPDAPAPAPAAVPGVRQTIDARELRGRRIRVSAGVGYPAIGETPEPWAAVVVAVHPGPDASSPALATTDGWPLWVPLCLAARPGEFKRVRAAFDVPPDAGSLTLHVSAQPGLRENTALVDNLAIELLAAD